MLTLDPRRQSCSSDSSLNQNEPGDHKQYKQVFANLVALDLNEVGYLCIHGSASWPALTACKRNNEKQKGGTAALEREYSSVAQVLQQHLLLLLGGHGGVNMENHPKLSLNRQGSFNATCTL